MFVFAAILFTLLVNSIRCDLTPIDPDYPTYNEHDFNTSRMFSTSSPSVMKGLVLIYFLKSLQLEKITIIIIMTGKVVIHFSQNQGH